MCNKLSVVPKNGAPGSREEQLTFIASYLDKYLKSLKPEFCEKSNNLTKAEWQAAEEHATSKKVVGNYMDYFGFFKNHVWRFLPEEMLFLLENFYMDVTYRGVPVSIQQALQFSKVNLYGYKVYASLCRQSYRLMRSNGPLKYPEQKIAESTGKLESYVLSREQEFLNLLRFVPNIMDKDPIACDSLDSFPEGTLTKNDRLKDCLRYWHRQYSSVEADVSKRQRLTPPETEEDSTASELFTHRKSRIVRNRLHMIQAEVEPPRQNPPEFDVYLPKVHFRKSDAGVASYHLRILPWTSSVPETVPSDKMLYAISGCAQIAMYSAQNVKASLQGS